MRSPLHRSVATTTPVTAGSRPSPIFAVKGSEKILRLQPLLLELGRMCGLASAMDDLGYYLSRLGVLKKMPHLLLMARSGAVTSVATLRAEDLIGAVLLYEYRTFGQSTSTFATDDTTGYRNLIALPGFRAEVAGEAIRHLMRRGAHVVLVSFQEENESAGPEISSIDPLLVQPGVSSQLFTTRRRPVLGYLQLMPTFEESLASLGSRTRNHLRYYRRRAEKEIGCTLESPASISRGDFLALNRGCSYAVTDEVAGWRYDSLRHLDKPVFLGMRDRDGQWLSLTGGRRSGDRTDIFWQMNREDLPSFSLSTVMRSYLIEHEVALGSRRLYFEGGTIHSMRHSFVPEQVTDVVTRRRSTRAYLVGKLSRHIMPQHNMLPQVLSDETLPWSSWQA